MQIFPFKDAAVLHFLQYTTVQNLKNVKITGVLKDGYIHSSVRLLI